jgi:RNA polymerase sigma factor (TIGR02999 family)
MAFPAEKTKADGRNEEDATRQTSRAFGPAAFMCDNRGVPGPEAEEDSAGRVVRLPPTSGGGASQAEPPAQPAAKADDPSQTPAQFDRVYEELRQLAGGQMRHERNGLTLQTTALVHEAYLRLMKDPESRWNSPGHFFAAAAEAMRRILVERARRHAARKHGGGRRRLDLDSVDAEAPHVAGDAEALLELDEALVDLKARDTRLGEVVMLRYFAGLSVDETAAALETSPRTVKRDWAFARAWLTRRLDEKEPGQAP